jgi:hypothetical protein
MLFLSLRAVLLFSLFCGSQAAATKTSAALKDLFGIEADQADANLTPENIETHHKMMILTNRENDGLRVQDFLVIVNLHDRPGTYRHYLGIKAPLQDVRIVKGPDAATTGVDQRGTYVEARLKKGVSPVQLTYRTKASKDQAADLTLRDQTLVGLQVFHNRDKIQLTFPTGQRIFQNDFASGTVGYEDTHFKKGETINLKAALVTEASGFLARLRKFVSRIALKIRITYYEATDSL